MIGHAWTRNNSIVTKIYSQVAAYVVISWATRRNERNSFACIYCARSATRSKRTVAVDLSLHSTYKGTLKCDLEVLKVCRMGIGGGGVKWPHVVISLTLFLEHRGSEPQPFIY